MGRHNLFLSPLHPPVAKVNPERVWYPAWIYDINSILNNDYPLLGHVGFLRKFSPPLPPLPPLIVDTADSHGLVRSFKLKFSRWKTENRNSDRVGARTETKRGIYLLYPVSSLNSIFFLFSRKFAWIVFPSMDRNSTERISTTIFCLMVEKSVEEWNDSLRL